MFSNRQLIFPTAMLALSVGYLVSALSLGTPIAESGLTPSFFPMLVGAAAILFSSLLILQQLRAPEAPDRPRDAPGHAHLWIVLAIFLYILAFRTLGYLVSSTAFVFALIVLFSSFEKPAQKALIALVVVGLGYVMFQHLFGVRLPTPWG